MSTETQTPQNIFSTFTPFEQGVLNTCSLQRRVSLTSAQPPVQESVDAVPYPEGALEWLVSLLNLLTRIVNKHKNFDRVVVVTKTEYQQFSEVLDDLIYGVGEDENHPLSPVMTLVGLIIKTYEDKHCPKLTESLSKLSREYLR